MNRFLQIRGLAATYWFSWIGLCLLALMTSSCVILTAPAQPGLVKPPAEIASEDESVDHSCAYFYYLWGKSAELDNRFDEALEAYEKLLRCDNGSVETLRNLGTLLVKMNRPEEAVKWFRELVAKSPDNVNARQLLAGLYASMGRTEEAIKEYEHLLAISEDEQAMLMLAALHAREKRFDAARQVLERMILREENSYMGHYNLGRLLRQQQLSPEAIGAYEKALEINWSLPLAFELAEYYEVLGKFDDAANLFREILDEDESSEEVRIRLINVLLSAGQSEMALVELGALREYVSDPLRVDISMARLHFTHKQYQEAADLLSSVVAADPEQHGARLLLGHSLYQHGDTVKALEALGAIPPESEKFEESVLARVRIFWEQDKKDGAIRVLQDKIAQENTRKKSFYVILASFFKEEGSHEKARQVLDQGLEQFPGNGELLYEYGIFLEKIGDQDGALKKMEKVLQLEPENSSALNYIGYTWADKGVNLDKALEYIQKAVTLSPDDGYIRDSLGWVYYRLGENAKALGELEKAVSMADDDPVIHEHLGDVYIKLERLDDARTAFEKAVELHEEEEKKESVRVKLERLGPTK